jgi:hypothetical protein
LRASEPRNWPKERRERLMSSSRTGFWGLQARDGSHHKLGTTRHSSNEYLIFGGCMGTQAALWAIRHRGQCPNKKIARFVALAGEEEPV